MRIYPITLFSYISIMDADNYTGVFFPTLSISVVKEGIRSVDRKGEGTGGTKIWVFGWLGKKTGKTGKRRNWRL